MSSPDAAINNFCDDLEKVVKKLKNEYDDEAHIAIQEVRDKLGKKINEDLNTNNSLFIKALESVGNLGSEKTNSEKDKILKEKLKKKLKDKSFEYENKGYNQSNVFDNPYLSLVYYTARNLVDNIHNALHAASIPRHSPMRAQETTRTPRETVFSLEKLKEAEENDSLFRGGKKTRKRKGIIRGKKSIKSKKSRKRKKIRKSHKNKRIIKRH